ncbi:hypothetical protein [Opitutus sp. ER46]|uniref:hypothetical protein n=1 Tax=Opitutus sp. ER46 TaxID=2161864 RepID=UPI000D323063|nr:hypothetical protein [Opitutus sp. ER46]PTX97778.1 hypothetical protein DB354_05735 [Opitutus sp. ER46]
MRRILVLFACGLVLWTVVTQLNHSLAPLHVYLFAGALFVTFAALTQPLTSGLLASLANGLVFDATTPVAFGTHFILFGLTHVFVYRVRERVPQQDTLSRIAITVIANLALFLVFTFVAFIRTPGAAAAWPRLFVDLIASQLFLVAATPWFFALQARALVLARRERPTFA